MNGIIGGAGVKMREALSEFKQRADSRLDSWVNEVTGYGTTRDKSTYGYVLPSRLLTDEELSSLYHGDDMAARMIDVVPQEMLREGFSVATGLPEIDASIADKMSDLDARGKLIDGETWGRAFGGGAVLIGADDGRDASLPLIPERAKDISYLYAMDRRLLWPMDFYEDQGNPKLGKPMTYQVTTYGGRSTSTSLVHESRLVIFGGAKTGIREKMQLYSWDMSVLQRAYDVLRSFNTGWKSVETLLTDGNQAIFKMTGLAEIIRAGGQDLLRARMTVMDLYRSVMRALVIDADGKESFERHSASFASVPETLDKFMLRLAAAVQIPVTILMGQSPAGMNATGDSDFRWFYDRIRAQQTSSLAPKIRRIVDVFLRTKMGQQLLKSKKLAQLNVNFPALWTETPLVQAQRELAIAQRDAVYVRDIQALTPEEVALGRFRNADGFDNEIRLSDEGVKARETMLGLDMKKLSEGGAAPEGEVDAEAPDAATVVETAKLVLTASDIAMVVTANEARISVGLGALPGPDGKLTLPEFKAKYAALIAKATNAEAGTVGEPPKASPKPAGGGFGGPPGGGFPPKAGGFPPKAPAEGDEADDEEQDDDAKLPAFITKEQREKNERLDAGPRSFTLYRNVDETGVSGTGEIAQGCVFADGKVAMRWKTSTASTTLFDKVEDVLKVHGHGGFTVMIYDDEKAKP